MFHLWVVLLYISPKSEPAKEQHSRAAPSVEAHHRVNGPDTGRNSGGRRIKNIITYCVLSFCFFFFLSLLCAKETFWKCVDILCESSHWGNHTRLDWYRRWPSLRCGRCRIPGRDCSHHCPSKFPELGD